MPRNPSETDLLGDRIGKALASIGITDERFSALLKRPCRCPQRRAWLNKLDLWARRVTAGKNENAERYLDEILVEHKEMLDKEDNK